MNDNKNLSVILLSYYSGDRIRRCYEKLGALLDKESIPFEFVVMDDGSKDNSYELAVELEKEKNNVRAYRLSRNFGSNYSALAGLSVCTGACAIPMVDDEQQPYETVVEMYRLWQQGHKVIIPCRKCRDDAFVSRTLSRAYYAVMNELSDVKFPPGGADLFFIDREVIDLLNKRIHPINTSGMVEVLRLGFHPYYLPYARPQGLNKRKSRWTLSKKIKLAKDTFFSASTFPVRLITWIGFSAFLLSIAASIFYIYVVIWGNQAFWGVRVPGWASLVILIFFFGGLIMLSLGIVAEYIWRIYEEVKNRPGYIIEQKND